MERVSVLICREDVIWAVRHPNRKRPLNWFSSYKAKQEFIQLCQGIREALISQDNTIPIMSIPMRPIIKRK